MATLTPVFRNNVWGTLGSPVANGTTTSFVLATGQGARFGTLGTDEFIPAVVVDTSTTPETVLEYVYITGITTDTLTVVRAAENAATYPAAAISAGITVAAIYSALTVPRYAQGTLATRPAAGTFGYGWYYATDDNGGTLYHSNSSAWTQQGAPANNVAGQELAYAAVTSNISNLTATAQADITGLSTSFNLAAGRSVNIRAKFPLVSLTLTSGTGYVMAFITDNSNVELTRAVWTAGATGQYGTISPEVRVAANSGTTNIKARYVVSGTGASATLYATVNYPMELQVVAV
jgi:hypothetical protein